jgi:hypothetical protein
MHVAAFLGLEDEVRQSIASKPELRSEFETWGNSLSAAAAGGQDNLLRLFNDVYTAPGPMPEMLTQKGSSAGAEGWTTLHWAASNGHISTCSLLIEYGAYFSMKSDHGYTAWDLARDHGHDEVATFLESFLSPRISDESKRTSLNTRALKRIAVISE